MSIEPLTTLDGMQPVWIAVQPDAAFEDPWIRVIDTRDEVMPVEIIRRIRSLQERVRELEEQKIEIEAKYMSVMNRNADAALDAEVSTLQTAADLMKQNTDLRAALESLLDYTDCRPGCTLTGSGTVCNCGRMEVDKTADMLTKDPTS